MNAKMLKGLMLVALLAGMAPLKAKAEAKEQMQVWEHQSRLRIEAALESSQIDVAQALNPTPENVFDFSDSGFQIVVVNAQQ